jgi:hypothetical protein
LVSNHPSRTSFLIRTYLLPQLAYPLDNALALIRAILHQQRLGPKLEAGLTVFLNDIERGLGDAAHALALVVARLLNNGAYALREVVVDDRQRGLTLLELCAVLDAEHVAQQSGHGVAADPDKLVDAVVEQVQAVRDDGLGRQVQ